MAKQLTEAQAAAIAEAVAAKAIQRYMLALAVTKAVNEAARWHAWMERQERRHREYQEMLEARKRGDATKSAGWYGTDGQKVVRRLR